MTALPPPREGAAGGPWAGEVGSATARKHLPAVPADRGSPSFPASPLPAGPPTHGVSAAAAQGGREGDLQGPLRSAGGDGPLRPQESLHRALSGLPAAFEALSRSVDPAEPARGLGPGHPCWAASKGWPPTWPHGRGTPAPQARPPPAALYPVSPGPRAPVPAPHSEPAMRPVLTTTCSQPEPLGAPSPTSTRTAFQGPGGGKSCAHPPVNKPCVNLCIQACSVGHGEPCGEPCGEL